VPELFKRAATVVIDKIQLAGHRVTFRVEKSLKPEPNTCELAVWNLNEDQRAALEELKPKAQKATRGIPCQIDAGYGDETSLIWLGDLRTVDSIREGPDWVTRLTSGDGEKAWKNARVNVSYGPRTPVETVLRALVRALGVGEGNVSKVAAQLKLTGVGKLLTHGTVISGPAARELDAWARSADLEWSIQDGAIQFLDRGKAAAGTALRISAASGMIGSPTVDNEGVLSCQVLIIPDVRPGSLIVMDARRVKGNYRIERAIWDGDTFGGQSPWYIHIEAKRY
jgi:hypothetical protein